MSPQRIPRIMWESIPFVLLLAVPLAAQAAPPWSSILDPSRAIDWSQAGVIGPDGSKGIPNFPDCTAATVRAGVAGDIQAAIDACPNRTVIRIPAGTYNLPGGLSITHPVVLRGAGSSLTKFITGGSISFNPYGSGGVPTNTRAVNWTGGYAQGSTLITLSSITGLTTGQEIVLDQLNDTSLVNVIGNEGHCGPGGAGNGCGRSNDVSAACSYGFCASDARAMPQIVGVSAIQWNQVTLDTPVYFTHQASLSPQAFFWAGGNMKYAGIENIGIDAQYNSRAIAMQFCTGCWVKGVEVDHIARGAINVFWTSHNEIRDSYFNQSQAIAPENYGIENDNNSATLMENNIFHNTDAGIMVGWPNSGIVVAYNYTLNNPPAAPQLIGNLSSHDAHNYMNLFEGNITPRLYFDFIWGSSSHETVFRNYFSGFQDPRLSPAPNQYYSNFNMPVVMEAWNRYMNFLGNVLGTAGIHAVYQAADGSQDPVVENYFDENFNNITTTAWNGACNGGLKPTCLGMGVGPIYTLGSFNMYSPSTTGFDTQVLSTFLRGGNFDYATRSAIWQDNAPADGSTYLPRQSLPPSFYLSGKPSWWRNATWPAIGPDVSGGQDSAGHANKIPAQICFENTIATGIPFNADRCYGAGGSGSAPLSPRNLRIR